MSRTTADYWIASGGKWRTARKRFRCQGGPLSKRCTNYVEPGERYLDTGEFSDASDSPWATIRCCKACADKPT